MIRACLVGDQPLARDGVAGLLTTVNEFEITAMAAEEAGVLDVVLATRPDVLILDLKPCDRDCLALLNELKRANRLPPTLVLTSFEEDFPLVDAVKAGAKGYLPKDVTADQLTSAVRVLARGGTFFQPAVTERITRGLMEGSASPRPVRLKYPLTGREIEVLRLLAGGFNNREIAELLGIVEGTVKNHVSSILAKLEVRDRIRAVLKALESGIFSCQDQGAEDRSRSAV